MLSQRKPQGPNTSFTQNEQSELAPAKDEDISIIQLDLQFASNLRLGVQHKEDQALCLGIPKDYTKVQEYHVLRFERYFKLPVELRMLRDKLMKEAINDPKRL